MTTLVHDDLIAVTKDFATDQLLPRAAALDLADPRTIADVWRHLVELNLDRALLADDLGGADLGADDFLAVLEEVAVGDAGVALSVLLNNVALVSLPAVLVRALPAGTRWTLALVPAGAEPLRDGVDPAAGSIRLSGALPAVLGGVDAAGIVVAARGPVPAVVAVAAGAAGLAVHPDPVQLGLRAARSADLLFTDVDLPLAPGLDADAVESHACSLVRCGVAAISRGIARRAREIALAYAHTRIQGGKRIVEHGAVADMLAEMSVRLRTLGGPPGAACDHPAAALAHKIAASDAALQTTVDAVQVMGGIGYLVDTGVEKLMRDAKYCQLYPEPNWLARDELMRLTG